ncbi:Sec7 domain containing protein [Aphelenchoides avenae]|nr:Sec7 domain containing protein [Aphelenchus avenae]
MMVNGLYVVQGEANAVVALLKKSLPQNAYHTLDDQDPFLRNFADLRDIMNTVTDLSEMNPDSYLSPFLDVIKSDHTNGPVTARAMSAVEKFINYELITANNIKVCSAVESVAQAATQAKFTGSSDADKDECVLFNLLKLLRTLFQSSYGRFLSNESVCEIMQCGFRICFESSLSSLIRKTAESTLSDITQLLFIRLPTFQEDTRHPYIRKLVMKSRGGRRKRVLRDRTISEDHGHSDDSTRKRENGPRENKEAHQEPAEPKNTDEDSPLIPSAEAAENDGNMPDVEDVIR